MSAMGSGSISRFLDLWSIFGLGLDLGLTIYWDTVFGFHRYQSFFWNRKQDTDAALGWRGYLE
jgi:hypothetical protein